MVSVIRESYGFNDEKVLDVMLKVPRHEFAPKKYWDVSYDDCPVDIGFGQTMSQPFTVAKMTDLLLANRDTQYAKRNTRVLEVGTGSGYQAAVLSYFFAEVYTLEIVPQLAKQAGEILKKLGYQNVFVKNGSGEQGWKEKASYDAIIMTAGVEEVPKELYEQLKIGGVLVAPVGKGRDKVMTRYTKINKNIYKFPISTNEHQLQENKRTRKIGKFTFKIETFGTFHFVPFVNKGDG